jgi:5'-AMP-activated protein kinase regulatory gamma subunit
VQPGTPLTTALTMLLETGVSALPVVDENRCLLDIYARADITKLAKGNAYNRLQWEAVTVGQALALAAPGPAAWAQSGARA